MNEIKTRSGRKRTQSDWLLMFLIIHGSASLLHFIHNGVFIDEYPNLPGWISANGVYVTWFGITGIGIVGYLLMHFGKRVAGLVTCAIYGVFGVDGLSHYTLAPISAHTFTMNFTIMLEAATAIIVLIVVAGLMVNHFRGRLQAVCE